MLREFTLETNGEAITIDVLAIVAFTEDKKGVTKVFVGGTEFLLRTSYKTLAELLKTYKRQ